MNKRGACRCCGAVVLVSHQTGRLRLVEEAQTDGQVRSKKWALQSTVVAHASPWCDSWRRAVHTTGWQLTAAGLEALEQWKGREAAAALGGVEALATASA